MGWKHVKTILLIHKQVKKREQPFWGKILVKESLQQLKFWYEKN